MQSIDEATEHPMIEHNGKMVHKNNSEGKPIHSTDEGIKNFHNWFSGSRAVEPMTNSKQKLTDVRPLVMYHGTHANFNKFHTTSTGTVSHTFGEYSTPRHGVFVTPNKDFAETFAKQDKGHGANVMPLYINAKKPLDITNGFDSEDRDRLRAHGLEDHHMNIHPHQAWQLFDGDDHFINCVKKAGYDSVVMHEYDHETDKEHEVWAIPHNHQIKSALGNSGDFSNKSNNITEEIK